jgi:hypothetical protein
LVRHPLAVVRPAGSQDLIADLLSVDPEAIRAERGRKEPRGSNRSLVEKSRRNIFTGPVGHGPPSTSAGTVAGHVASENRGLCQSPAAVSSAFRTSPVFSTSADPSRFSIYRHALIGVGLCFSCDSDRTRPLSHISARPDAINSGWLVT